MIASATASKTDTYTGVGGDRSSRSGLKYGRGSITGRNYERRRKIPRVITGGLSEPGPIGSRRENSKLERRRSVKEARVRRWDEGKEEEEEVGRKTRRGTRDDERNYSDN